MKIPKLSFLVMLLLLIPITASATFVVKQVKQLTEINATDHYIIITETSPKNFTILTAKTYKTHLQGTPLKSFDGEEILEEDSAFLWHFVPQNQGIQLKALLSNQKIGKGSAKTDLNLIANQSDKNKIINFLLSFDNDGKCKLTPSYEIKRALAASTAYPYFGLYIDAAPTYIYKIVQGVKPLKSVIPTHENQSVGLVTHWNEERAYYCNGNKALQIINQEGCRLLNNNWKLNNHQAHWNVERLSENKFKLKSVNGYYLTIDSLQQISPLPYPSENSFWQITEGVLNYQTPTKSYVLGISLQAPNELRVVEQKNLDTRFVLPLSLVSLAGSSELKIEGKVGALKGEWNKKEIDSIIHQTDLLALYLEEAVLPYQPFDYANPAFPNRLFYIQAEQAKQFTLPANRILNKEPYVLLDTLKLTDLHPFKVSAPFIAPAKKIYYKRAITSDGNWNTCILPFTCYAYKPFVLATLQEQETDNLIFENQVKCLANTPFIFTIPSDTNTLFEVFNQEEELIIPIKASGLLKGTYAEMKVSEPVSSYYFLNPTGEAFINAPQQSTLHPFRAYLQLNTLKAPLAIKIKSPTTSILNFKQAIDSQTLIYNLSGKITQTTKGINIINRKKIYTP